MSGHYAIHFQVRRAQTNSCADPAPGSYPTLLGTVSTAASTEFLTGQPAANTAYWYIVQAEWSDGVSSASAPACWPGGGQSKNDSLPGGIRWPSSEGDFRIAAAGSFGPAKREARDYGVQEFVPSSHRLIGQSGGANPAVSLYFYHLDHLGTPRVITDVNENVVSKHKYLPFGEEMSPPLSSNTHKFTGHERDKETGLDYMLARYYGNSLGRFMSPDPLPGHVHLPQTLNRYIYAGNNPIVFIDPDGLDFYLKCEGESDSCQGSIQGKTTTDEDGNKTFTPTEVREEDGKLTDGENTYSGTVDSEGVHLTNEATGKESTGTWKADSNPVSFTQESGELADFTFSFIENPHFGQDARGTYTYSGSYEDAQAALGEAGFKQIHGLQPGIDFKTKDKSNKTNVAHAGLQKSGLGTIHTGESRGLRHVPEALVNAIESALGLHLGGR